MENTIIIDSVENVVIEPAFEQHNVPLCLFASNAYAPYCGVLIHSVVQNSSVENNYDIIVMERDISSNNKRLMLSMIEGKENFSIRFINLAELSKQISASVHGHFALEGSLKLYLLTNIFSRYDKFVTTDSDLVFNHDVAELYATDVDGVYMAAVDDVIMKQLVADKHISGSNSKAPKMPSGDYIADYLGMGSSDVYYNTGVVVFNLKYCRENQLFEKALEKLNSKHYWFIEQDVLNEICGKQVALLDLKWNVLSGNTGLARIKQVLSADLYEKFMDSLDNYYIMHFAGNHKPWFEPGLEYSERFFEYARTSPWYEQIMFSMNVAAMHRVADRKIAVINSKKVEKKRFLKILPLHSKRRELVKGLMRKTSLKWVWHYVKIPLKLKRMNIADHIPFSIAYKAKRKMRSLKDSHLNERCFIIGNGPSLCKEDVELLENEITFATNRIFPIFQNTAWRPTYYFLQESEVYASNKEVISGYLDDIKEYGLNKVFVPYGDFAKKVRSVMGENCFVFPFEQDWCMYKQNLNYMGAKFSRDCSDRIYGAFTTIYSIVQLAVYMGFKEIYFVGTDCNYQVGARHFYEVANDDSEAVFDTFGKCAADSNGVLSGFLTLQKALQNDETIKIYNATRGGMLEAFPRVDLTNLFNKEREK